ncbi:PucR family transcriptional regulator [Nocardia farcinica]|uniref:PucR family transcriptional regulator n=1 Tax=Nocardia farcinica TaxID=37329 RepID=UPI00189360FB|nr:helix-turn-helix domain-containing protein [Nocardia farcinica]MBF6271584.1 helix-turn-helix domain-containing protein [Nocardia farcinica]
MAVFGADYPTIDDLGAETAIRLARGLDLAALIFISQTSRDALVTTRRLADKLRLPVIIAKSPSPVEAIERLDYLARFPELGTARSLREFIRRLPHIGLSPDRILTALAEQLACPVAVMDSSGRQVRGPVEVEVESGEILEHLRRVPASARSIDGASGETIVIEPITRLKDRAANLWLVAKLESRTEEHVDHARHLLAVASWPLTTELLQRTLSAEREGRQRAMLLTEIIEHSTSLPRQTVERATALGWQLSGWHTAIAITSSDGQSNSRGHLAARVVEDGLKLHGINADLVERPDGWVFWTTTEVEPATDDGLALVDRIRTALMWVHDEVPSASLSAGVGLPFEGVEGLRKSIEEAEHACLLARTDRRPVVVEHSDATSVRRLLIGYYSNRALREVAAHLMAPLRQADTSGELERTMAAFLDNKSSATATAKALGVHRNTVLYRIEEQ